MSAIGEEHRVGIHPGTHCHQIVSLASVSPHVSIPNSLILLQHFTSKYINRAIPDLYL
jgi:hypothetical protein